MQRKLVYKEFLPSGLNIQPHGVGWASELGATKAAGDEEPALGPMS